MRLQQLGWIVCFVLALTTIAQCSVVRVRVDGDDANDGSTWALAKKTVSGGLATAVSGDEVWVAKGTYVESVTLKDGVGLYGVFAGVESLRDQRDRKKNLTMLDFRAQGSTVYAPAGAGSSSIIDGFTIENNGPYGRIVFTNVIGCGPSSSPRISNNTISHCRVYDGGGAGIICANGSSPDIVDNIVAGNSVAHGPIGSMGGGMYCESGSSPRISGNLFRGNSAGLGSAILCGSPTAIICNNTFEANSGTTSLIFTVYCTGSAVVFGNTFIRNYVGAGAAIYSDYGSPTIAGNIITDTQGYSYSAAIGCRSGSPGVLNNTITGNKSYGIRCELAASPVVRDESSRSTSAAVL